MSKGPERIIHLIGEEESSFPSHSWTIQYYQESKIEEYLSEFDNDLKTHYLEGYQKARRKLEYFKYVILHEKGGIFVRYNHVNEIDFEQIEQIVQYFTRREITLFACPSMIVSCQHKHPQLLSILTNPDGFIPLSSIYTHSGEDEGYKTLVTSLTIGKYLKKISADTERKSWLLPITSFVSGLLFGLWLNRSNSSE